MNYQRIYELIIQKGKLRGICSKKPLGFERHHIIPKSFGGSNSLENLVDLTPREHFICHWLLKNIYGGKMSSAWFLMCHTSTTTKHIATSHEYEFAKRSWIKASRLSHIGTHHTSETREKMRQKAIGRGHTSTTKKRLAEVKTNVPNSNESKKKNKNEALKQWDDLEKRKKLVAKRISKLIIFAESYKNKTNAYLPNEALLDRLTRCIKNDLLSYNDLRDGVTKEMIEKKFLQIFKRQITTI